MLKSWVVNSVVGICDHLQIGHITNSMDNPTDRGQGGFRVDFKLARVKNRSAQYNEKKDSGIITQAKPPAFVAVVVYSESGTHVFSSEICVDADRIQQMMRGEEMQVFQCRGQVSLLPAAVMGC